MRWHWIALTGFMGVFAMGLLAAGAAFVNGMGWADARGLVVAFGIAAAVLGVPTLMSVIAATVYDMRVIMTAKANIAEIRAQQIRDRR